MSPLIIWLAVTSALPTARLEYSAPAQCPDAERFRALVASKLGQDVFADDAAPVLRVAVTAGRSQLEAQLTLEAPGMSGKRQMTGVGGCHDFVASVALAAAVALDPLLKRAETAVAAPEERHAPVAQANGHAPPPAAPMGAPRSTAADPRGAPPSAGAEPIAKAAAPTEEHALTPASSAAPPVQKTSLTLTWSASAGALGGIGTAPTLTAGGWAEVRAHRAALSLGLEGRLHTVGAIAIASGRGEVFSGSAVLVPCWTMGWFSGCVTAALGALKFTGLGLTQAASRTVLHAELGLKAQLEPPLSRHLFLRFFLEGALPLTRSAMVFGSTMIWRVPPVTGHVGAGLTWKF